MGDWLLIQQGGILYVMLFLLLMGGAVGLPIPEDLPLILAGVLTDRGQINLEAAFLVCYCTTLAGDALIFFIGRKFGTAIFQKKWVKSRIPNSRVRRVRVNLERRNILLIIIIARHLFVFRTITFLTCGAVRMHPKRFLFADAIAALSSVPLMMALGYFGSRHFEEILDAFDRAREISYVVAISLVVILGVLYYRHSKKEREEEAEEIENDFV